MITTRLLEEDRPSRRSVETPHDLQPCWLVFIVLLYGLVLLGTAHILIAAGFVLPSIPFQQSAIAVAGFAPTARLFVEHSVVDDSAITPALRGASPRNLMAAGALVEMAPNVTWVWLGEEQWVTFWCWKVARHSLDSLVSGRFKDHSRNPYWKWAIVRCFHLCATSCLAVPGGPVGPRAISPGRFLGFGAHPRRVARASGSAGDLPVSGRELGDRVRLCYWDSSVLRRGGAAAAGVFQPARSQSGRGCEVSCVLHLAEAVQANRRQRSRAAAAAGGRQVPDEQGQVTLCRGTWQLSAPAGTPLTIGHCPHFGDHFTLSLHAEATTKLGSTTWLAHCDKHGLPIPVGEMLATPERRLNRLHHHGDTTTTTIDKDFHHFLHSQLVSSSTGPRDASSQ